MKGDQAARLLREIRKTKPFNMACAYGAHDFRNVDYEHIGYKICNECGATYIRWIY